MQKFRNININLVKCRCSKAKLKVLVCYQAITYSPIFTRMKILKCEIDKQNIFKLLKGVEQR